jgi:hypothetical protein
MIIVIIKYRTQNLLILYAFNEACVAVEIHNDLIDYYDGYTIEYFESNESNNRETNIRSFKAGKNNKKCHVHFFEKDPSRRGNRSKQRQQPPRSSTTHSKRRQRKLVGNPRNIVGIWGDINRKFPTHFWFFLLISKYSFATNILELLAHFSRFSTENNFYLQLILRD